jgi:hypothetical protein
MCVRLASDPPDSLAGGGRWLTIVRAPSTRVLSAACGHERRLGEIRAADLDR